MQNYFFSVYLQILLKERIQFLRIRFLCFICGSFAVFAPLRERFISQFGFSQLACILTRINWSYTKTAARGKKILHSSPDVQLPSAYDLCIGFDSQTSSIGSNLSQEHYFISDVCSIQIQENTFGFPLTKVRNTTSNTYLSFIKI